MLKELHEQEPVQTQAEIDAANTRSLGRRDGEIYKALGYFIMAVGIPVLCGTYFAYQANETHPHAAVVNAICSLVLLGIGAASWVYGGVVLARHK
jgi:hypothetical protein